MRSLSSEAMSVLYGFETSFPFSMKCTLLSQEFTYISHVSEDIKFSPKVNPRFAKKCPHVTPSWCTWMVSGLFS